MWDKVIYLANYLVATTSGKTHIQEIQSEDLIYFTDLIIIFIFFIIVFLTGDFLAKYCQSTIYNRNAIKIKKIVTILMYSICLPLAIGAVMKCEYLHNAFEKVSALTSLPWILLSWIFSRVIDFFKKIEIPSLPDDFHDLQGLDYGTGMAFSYYYGYLKLILPLTGTDRKGLLEKIDNIEDIHGISVAVRKLLILIPSSTYIPPDLKAASNDWMECAIELEEETLDRAGVKRRSYKNNIYKIYPGGDKLNCTPLYVVAEGATPIFTFFEVLKHSHYETNVYKKHREHIIGNFYYKLKDLLNNDPECKDLCELIYYKDYDTNGRRVNVAKVICERLPEISRRN